MATENEYRVKRCIAEKGLSIRSVNATKSAFAHKVNNGGKFYSRNVKECVYTKGASKEVLVKVVSSSRTKRGMKASLSYMSEQGKITMLDDDGFNYQGSEGLNDAISGMTDSDDPSRLTNSHGKANPQLAKHIVFSPPVSADISQKDALASVREVLKEKYPDSRFILAYHDDKEHPHVHCLMRIRGDTIKTIDIKKQDLRQLRSDFCERLKQKGYDVKATHKQEIGLKDKLKAEAETVPNRQKNVLEVVGFGRDYYQFKRGNNAQNYVTVRTLNGKENTYWGKELGELCEREKIQKGSLIKLRKSGSEEVRIPQLDKDGNQTGWKTTKRNQWEMENIGLKGIDRSQKLPEKAAGLKEQLERLQRQQREFRQNAAKMIRREQKQKLKIGF